MNYENILVQLENSIQTITINRPSKLNALNKATIEELSQVLIASDKEASVRIVIITGAGEKAFVAGADISEFSEFSVEEGKGLSKKGHDELFSLIDQMKTPVIAAVNGFALGGGLRVGYVGPHSNIFRKRARRASRNLIRRDTWIWWNTASGSNCRKRSGYGNDLICRNDRCM